MMNEHPNTLLIRQAWQAVSVSDIETLKELWDEDIVWHVTGDNPWKGDHVGHEGVLEYLAEVGESGEKYDTTLIDVMASDTHAAIICHVRSERGDRVLEVDQVLLARMRNSRIREVWTLALDPHAITRFWASEPLDTFSTPLRCVEGGQPQS